MDEPCDMVVSCTSTPCPVTGMTIIIAMDRDAIVQAIDEEIERLGKARALLTGHTAPLERGLPRTTQPVGARKRWKMSAEGRARIAAAQWKRWAKPKRTWGLMPRPFYQHALRACFLLLGALQIVGLLVAFERPAHAYVDPGSGFVFLQVAGSTLAGTIYYMRRRLRRMISSMRKPAPTVPSAGTHTDAADTRQS